MQALQEVGSLEMKLQVFLLGGEEKTPNSIIHEIKQILPGAETLAIPRLHKN